MITLPTRSEFIRTLLRSGASDEAMACSLEEYDHDYAIEAMATAKAEEAAKKWHADKEATGNTCKCGALIAPESKCCRACVDNGAANAGPWMSNVTRRVAKTDVMTKGRYYQAGLVSPR